MFGRTKTMTRRDDPAGLMPWAPFREMEGMQEAISSALEDFFQGGRDIQAVSQAWTPAVNVEEREKDYVFSVEVPGLERDQLRVELQNGGIVVSGERKDERDEKRKNYLRHEQVIGAFRRSFSLPEDASAEGLKASYKSGILKITVPRSEKAKGKSVPINIE